MRIRFDGVSGDSNMGSITTSRGHFGVILGEVSPWGDSGDDGFALSEREGWALLGDVLKVVGR
jgi:hypothetical protein